MGYRNPNDSLPQKPVAPDDSSPFGLDFPEPSFEELLQRNPTYQVGLRCIKRKKIKKLKKELQCLLRNTSEAIDENGAVFIESKAEVDALVEQVLTLTQRVKQTNALKPCHKEKFLAYVLKATHYIQRIVYKRIPQNEQFAYLSKLQISVND